MSSSEGKTVFAFILTVLLQLLLLKHYPAFARTCDLPLLFLVTLALSRPPATSLLFALIAGTVFDSLSLHFPFTHTVFYGAVAVALSWQRQHLYLSHEFLFIPTALALVVGKAAFFYLWTVLFVQMVTPLVLLRVSFLGLLAFMLLAYLAAPRLLRLFKEPEVLDFDVGR
jgi:hypothetical protein